MRVGPRDRIQTVVAEPATSPGSGKQTLLILGCFFIPPFGFFFPFYRPTGPILFTAALLALAAILAFLFVPKTNGIRFRLMLFGGLGSATLLYLTFKPMLGF